MSIRSPNPEQTLAIKHSGGVLLSAGAGSGKTFVLVEHIIHLLKNFLEKSHESLTLENDIKKYLNSVVMMTFTKKASGEMASRLHKRIKNEQDLDIQNINFWNLVSKNLTSLYVGTIHGFCFKLIAGNFFPEMKSEFEIIDSDTQKTKLVELFDNWYLETKGDRENFLNKVILIHRKQILDSVFDIFSSPDLREQWSISKTLDLSHFKLSQTMLEIIEAESWGHVCSGRFSLSGHEAHSSLAWYKNIQGFIGAVTSHNSDWDNVAYWETIGTFFESVKSWTKTSKKNKIFEVDDFIEDIKLFKDFFKSNGTGLVAYLNDSTIFESWLNDFDSLFHFINDRYDKLGGLTFSDLEYNVSKGLSTNAETIKKIGNQYKYFIVDEFQDTSEVQFGILKNLVSNDFNKLFCVGDVKQAIYGFRGGELSVFSSCATKISQNLNLTKNYRSKEKVINLNNTLFDHLFKLGTNYQGLEKDPVEVEYQECPGDDSSSGNVTRILVEVESEKLPSSRDMDIIEADALFKSIVKKTSEEGTIGILYKNLGASGHLIPKMIEAEMSFTAQVKIPMKEGPLWALFSTLLEGYLNKNSKYPVKNVGFIVYGILQWLGSNIKPNLIEDMIFKFYANVGLLGFVTSFDILVSNLGLSDADYEKNFSKIAQLDELAGEDPEKLYSLMREFGSEKISVEFRYGDTPEQIFIMTAHGAKGLEFEHVFLGGIHTNGRSVNDSPLLGKLPGSLKWKLNAEQKDYFKSPMYLLEEKRIKKKDFSESKRLFYVACTRAKNSLTFIDLEREGKGLKYSLDSWINGFRLYEQDGGETSSFSRGDITEERSDSISFKGRELNDDLQAPLFQRDNLGVLVRDKVPNDLGLLAEVSVTRLATLAQCPRKFYLSNICKMDEDDLERLGIVNDKQIHEVKSYKDEDENIVPVKSNAERGIFVHDAISRAIIGNLLCPLDVEGKNKEAVSYVLEQLKEKSAYTFLSEVPVKFSLFGQMISGTPDLVLRPLDKKIIPEVWDFKTGSQKENSELAYWFQLFCYGIQTCDDMGLSADDEILLALVYVDQKKNVTRSFTKGQLESLLFVEWKKLSNFAQVNTDHCESCSFEKLCEIAPS